MAGPFLAAIASATLLSTVFAPGLFAQTTNPPYIAEMPSVDKVTKAMQRLG